MLRRGLGEVTYFFNFYAPHDSMWRLNVQTEKSVCVWPQRVLCKHCHVMHGRPHFLFSSGVQCSAWFALLESSMHCTWPTQRSSFFIVVSTTFCPAVFLAPCSFIIKYAFSILFRQNAIVSFNCRFVTIIRCNSTATCALVSSLTTGIHALLYTNLQAKFLKIRGL